MRRFVIVVLIVVFVLSLTQAFGQLSRKNQFEIYAGAGFPLGPDYFKDYYEMGLSLNVQYVAFPTMRLGIPILVSASAATRFSVDLARKTNMTLVGMVEDDRIVVYNDGGRIAGL